MCGISLSWCIQTEPSLCYLRWDQEITPSQRDDDVDNVTDAADLNWSPPDTTLNAWHIILWHPQSHWSHLRNHFNLLTTEPLFSLFPHQSFAVKFFFHPHRDTVKIFHFRMDVHIFKHQVIHHTSLFFFPSHTKGKTRSVWDQCALWHLNMSKWRNMSTTASSGQGWLGGRGGGENRGGEEE